MWLKKRGKSNHTQTKLNQMYNISISFLLDWEAYMSTGRRDANTMHFFVESILNSNRDSYVVIEIAHALVSSRTSVHGQGHADNKRVMMNDVLPSKKWARAHRAERPHVGSRYGPLTTLNGLEN